MCIYHIKPLYSLRFRIHTPEYRACPRMVGLFCLYSRSRLIYSRSLLIYTWVLRARARSLSLSVSLSLSLSLCHTHTPEYRASQPFSPGHPLSHAVAAAKDTHVVLAPMSATKNKTDLHVVLASMYAAAIYAIFGVWAGRFASQHLIQFNISISISISMCVCVCVCVCIYIYIYILANGTHCSGDLVQFCLVTYIYKQTHNTTE